MSHTIKNWSDIENQYKKGSLLLGNGASIAISDKFRYKNLYEHAKNEGLLDCKTQALFNSFNTTDFEYILRKLWQASLVNEALGIEENAVNAGYAQVRDSLFQAILKIHPKKSEVSDSLDSISKFLLKFKTVLSLNYDLIVYWAMMHSNRHEQQQMKDAFLGQYFELDYGRLRNNKYNPAIEDTLVFYPHGNLILTRLNDSAYAEKKLTIKHIKAVLDEPISTQSNWLDVFNNAPSPESDLLESIGLYYNKQNFETPLFISEGTAEHKEASIKFNPYLNFIANTIIKTDLGKSLTVYGWSFGVHDEHILKSMVQDNKTSTLERIAVSVYNNDQEFCSRVSKKIKDILPEGIDIDFFNSESRNCWNSSTT